jgi:hypothetical protein
MNSCETHLDSIEEILDSAREKMNQLKNDIREIKPVREPVDRIFRSYNATLENVIVKTKEHISKMDRLLKNQSGGKRNKTYRRKH